MAEEKQVTNARGRVIGLDVHPELYSAAAFPNRKGITLDDDPLWIQHRLKISGIDKWLKKNIRPGDLFVLEAGSNSFEIVTRIEKAGGMAVVLESQRAGQIRKAYLKNDKVDAEKVARIYLSGLAHEVWVPDEKTKIHREIFNTYNNAKKDTVRSRNQIWAWLAAHGLKQKTGVELTKPSGLRWLLCCNDWTNEQKMIVESLVEKHVFACKQRKMFKSIMAHEVTSDPEMLKLLRIYGLRHIIIYALMAFIGDISRFRNPKKLVAYIGLQPKVDESGKNNKNGSLVKAGRKDLRALMVQAANCILNTCPSDHPFAKWGVKLLFKKPRGVAVIAVARKVTVAVWYLLRGFFTPLQESSKSLKTKLTKLAIEIGPKKRKEMNYKTILDFILEKEKILIESS